MYLLGVARFHIVVVLIGRNVKDSYLHLKCIGSSQGLNECSLYFSKKESIGYSQDVLFLWLSGVLKYNKCWVSKESKGRQLQICITWEYILNHVSWQEIFSYRIVLGLVQSTGILVWVSKKQRVWSLYQHYLFMLDLKVSHGRSHKVFAL